MVMKAFSKMLSMAVGGGFYLGFLVGDTNRNTFNISHLLFADDSLIFSDVYHNLMRHFFYVLKLSLA